MNTLLIKQLSSKRFCEVKYAPVANGTCFLRNESFNQIFSIDCALFTFCILGGESVGIVELAPNPKVPQDKLEAAKERDFKCGTIETGFFNIYYFHDSFQWLYLVSVKFSF